MADLAIRAEGICKRYRIGGQRLPYKTFRDAIADCFRFPLRRRAGPTGETRRSGSETIWALKDVSFDIARGEVVGVIGRNGAGKSTLLKILSRITEPTEGYAEIGGRIGSLLEVGTGFHLELTGRENIFLNGAILGMKKSEIVAKFDEIVAFAEVEKFVDTPVKHYSSGMYLRLAFSVAAHLEPEILLVDEVLAVGDAGFQRKCLGKMGDVARGGRTVLFVSHQMAAVQNLCSRAIWLERGLLAAQGETERVIGAYLSTANEMSHFPLEDRRDRRGTGDIRFTAVILEDEEGRPVSCLRNGKDATIVLGYRNLSGGDLNNVRIDVGIDNQMAQRIAWISNVLTDEVFHRIPSDRDGVEIRIPNLPLVAGRYGLTICCTIGGVVADWIQNAVYIDVESGNYYGTGKTAPHGQGSVLLDFNCRVRERRMDAAGS
jgi:lipopolysaccharide transport system ATP-binding protein